MSLENGEIESWEKSQFNMNCKLAIKCQLNYRVGKCRIRKIRNWELGKMKIGKWENWELERFLN